MKYSDWMDSIEPQKTSTGARIDLRLYVYPDGHGIISSQQSGKTGRPVNSFDQAIDLLRDIWEKAATANQPVSGQKEAELAEMLERITPENLHAEIADNGPVGNEAW